MTDTAEPTDRGPDGRARPARRAVAVEAGTVVAVSLAVAVAATWPLAPQLGTIAHDPFDPRFQAWTIEWVQHTLLRDPLGIWDANIFHPEATTLAYSDALLGVAVPLLPLRLLGLEPIAIVNLAILLGMATNAAAGYLFGRVVTASRTVAAVTGAAFAFGPFGTLSAGAVHATAVAGIAAAATAAWWLVERASRDAALTAPAVALALAVCWQVSVSFYPGAYAIVAAAVVLVVRAPDLGRRGLVATALAAAGIGAVVLALARPYLVVRGRYEEFGRGLEDLGALGADFTRVDPRISLWGRWLGLGEPTWPVFGQPAFPGAVLLVLAPIGIVAGWRAGGARRRVSLGALGLVVAGAFLALGTAPAGWRRFSPYRLLFEFVPGFEALRATGRAWKLGLLGVGVLAGIGALVVAGALARRVPGLDGRRARLAVAVVAVVALVGEGYAPWTGRPEVRVPAVDVAVAAQPEPGAVLSLPLREPGEVAGALSGLRQVEHVYGSTAHLRPTPNGYSGFFPPSWFALSRAMTGLPDAASIGHLHDLGVRFVVVRSWAEGGAWAHLLDPQRARPLRLLGDYDGDLLYAVPEVRDTAPGGARR